MRSLINIEVVFYFMLFILIIYLIYFTLLISYCYSDKEELKLSDLSKTDIDSKEMIRFLILPYYNVEEMIYYKTKLRYLRNIILYGEYSLFTSIALIFIYFLFFDK